MALVDKDHEFVMNGCVTKNDAQKKDSNEIINCNGSGNFWTTLENYQTVKYVNLFTGKTVFKPAGGLPFAKFPWRKNIQIIDTREKIINLPKVNDYKTQNGASVVADLFIQYSITDTAKYIEHNINLTEKISENIKAIMLSYFRKRDHNQIAQADISLNSIGREKFNELEKSYGIKFTTLGCTNLKFPEIDDDKTKRVENELRYQNKMEEFDNQINLADRIKKLEISNATIEAEKINTIMEKLGIPRKEAMKMYEMQKITEAAKDGANINFFRGLPDYEANKTSGRRRR